MAARVEARQAEWAQRAAEIAHERSRTRRSPTAASLWRHGGLAPASTPRCTSSGASCCARALLEEMAPFEPGWAPFEPYGAGRETMDERAPSAGAARGEAEKGDAAFSVPAGAQRALARDGDAPGLAPPRRRASRRPAAPRTRRRSVLVPPRLNPNSASTARARRRRASRASTRWRAGRAPAREGAATARGAQSHSSTLHIRPESKPAAARRRGGQGRDLRRCDACSSAARATARAGGGAGARARRVHVPAGGGGRRRRRGGDGGGGGRRTAAPGTDSGWRGRRSRARCGIRRRRRRTPTDRAGQAR